MRVATDWSWFVDRNMKLGEVHRGREVKVGGLETTHDHESFEMSAAVRLGRSDQVLRNQEGK